jgi:D-glycerate 3-kinase
MTEHVLSHLAQHKAESRSPLFVAVQGPQGIGKTFLTSILHDVLTVPPHALRVAVLSIDDLYLPHDALSALAQAHPENKLLHGRGMPGTHDVPLGTRALRALKDINNAPTADDASPVKSVTLPVFDKSLYGGEGDRLPESAGKVVCAPVDVVMLEGWCVGFCPIANDVLEKRWEAPVQGLDAFDMRRFTKQNLGIVNEMLEAYIDWWTLFDIFIQVGAMATCLSVSTRSYRGADLANTRVTVCLHLQMETRAGALHEVS